MKNFIRGLGHALVVFVGLYGASLVHLIPKDISEMTVGSLIALVIAWISHAQITPAGSVVIKPTK